MALLPLLFHSLLLEYVTEYRLPQRFHELPKTGDLQIQHFQLSHIHSDHNRFSPVDHSLFRYFHSDDLRKKTETIMDRSVYFLSKLHVDLPRNDATVYGHQSLSSRQISVDG